jgi:hypothetical protein
MASIFSGVGQEVKVEYFPSLDPDPSIMIKKSMYSRIETSQAANLLRLTKEIEVATALLKFQKPDILFIDGSILPLSSDFNFLNPSSTFIEELILNLKKHYQEFLNTLQKQKTFVMGIVKDSRSRSAVNVVKQILESLVKQRPDQFKGYLETFEDILDIQLFYHLLDQGYKSIWFPQKLPTLFQTQGLLSWFCYAKTIDDEFPVRLEIFTGAITAEILKNIELVLQIVYYTSQHNIGGGIPSVIIDVNDRVKINQGFIKEVITQIAVETQTPMNLLLKRRESQNI